MLVESGLKVIHKNTKQWLISLVLTTAHNYRFKGHFQSEPWLAICPLILLLHLLLDY